MTDLEAFRAMLTRANIPFEEQKDDDDPSAIVVHLSADNSYEFPAMQGYSGFFAEFHFRDDGSLAAAGLWE